MKNTELDNITLLNDAREGERMLAAVYDFLGRFIAYPSDHARVAHALWIVHAHLMDRWESTPRIAFLSAEPASGKSRALEITEMLVPNPMVAVNVSPSYLFRKVAEEVAPTILFDEIDTVFGPKAKENEEIRGLLNAGHRRGATAGRCVVRGKEVTTEELPAYSAVALAGLGWLPDTILSRSIVVRMRRRSASEQVEQYRRRIHRPEGDKVRMLIELWTRSVPEEITWPDLPPEIQDRDADVWEPLIVVADLAGGEWPARARAAAVEIIGSRKEVEPSLGIRLLADVRTVFGAKMSMPTATILEALHNMEEAPWGDLKGKPLDSRGLANRLREYSVHSKVMWFGNKQARGYDRADLRDAWERYLPQQAAGHVTSVTNVTPLHAAPMTHVTDVTPVAAGKRKCGHCGEYGRGPVKEVHYDNVVTYLHDQCEAQWIASYRDRVG
jgi:hypothetical protein